MVDNLAEIELTPEELASIKGPQAGAPEIELSPDELQSLGVAPAPATEQPDIRSLAQNLAKGILGKMGGKFGRQIAGGPGEAFGEFGGRIGAQAGLDISEAVQEAPGQIGEMLQELPGQVADVPSVLRHDPARAARAGAAGLGKVGYQAAAFPSNVAQFLERAGVVSPEVAGAVPKPSEDIPQMLKEFIGPGERPADVLLSGLAEFAPYLAGGAALKASRAAAPAAFGAVQADDPIKGLVMGLTGAAVPEAVAGVAKGAIKGVQKARPSKALRGSLTPEELAENLRATKGTPTQLGEVVESPGLKGFYENVLSKIPGTGMEKVLGKAGDIVKTRGESMLDELVDLKKRPQDLELAMGESLKGAKDKHTRIKNELYEKSNEMHASEGKPLEFPKMRELAGEAAQTLQEHSLLRFDPAQNKLFNKIAGLSKEVGERVEGGPEISLSEANQLAGILNQTARKAGKSPDQTQRAMAKMYGGLGRALKDDIKASLKKNNSKELQDAFKGAEKNYAKNFSPFLDSEVYKYIEGGKSTEKIASELIGSGKQDRFQSIQKVMELMPDDQKNYLGTAYLEKAINKESGLDPGKLKTLIKNLGKRQFNALFPDKGIRQALTDYSKLTAKNQAALNKMFNPPTGKTLLDWMPYLITALGTGIGAATAGDVGALAGVLGTTISGIGGGRGLSKLLSSEKVRNKLVSKMIEDSIKTKGKKPIDAKVQERLVKSLEAVMLPQLIEEK